MLATLAVSENKGVNVSYEKSIVFIQYHVVVEKSALGESTYVGLTAVRNLSYDRYILFFSIALRLLNLIWLNRWLGGGEGTSSGASRCRTIPIGPRPVIEGAAGSPILELAVGASASPFVRQRNAIQERAVVGMGGTVVYFYH